jgi:hypothetical protein
MVLIFFLLCLNILFIMFYNIFIFVFLFCMLVLYFVYSAFLYFLCIISLFVISCNYFCVSLPATATEWKPFCSIYNII